VRFCFGTDSQIQIDLLEDARELEYHLRLERIERVILGGGARSDLAARLFEFATAQGNRALHGSSGDLAENHSADFFTVDLNDPSIAGSSEDALLSTIVFSLERTAIRDVIVRGRPVIQNGAHPLQEEVVARFAELQRRLWAS
jgi:formimidoylglutamate deiminase